MTLGYNADFLVGTHVLSYIAQEFHELVIAKMTSRQEGTDTSPYEIVMITKDGARRSVIVKASPIQFQNNPAILLLLIDITDRKIMEEKIVASLLEKETLLREIHHRVKNNLQIITSLLSLQIRQVSDSATIEALRDSQNRVKTMALVHEHLYRGSDISNIDLEHYVRSLGTMLFQTYQQENNKIRFEVSARNIFLDINMAIPVGLIINELITNSFKYAFEGKVQGIISITGSENPDEITIIVADDGIGIDMIPPDTSGSLGLRLVNTLIRQLKGSIAFSQEGGTTITLSIPKDTKPEGKGSQ